MASPVSYGRQAALICFTKRRKTKSKVKEVEDSWRGDVLEPLKKTAKSVGISNILPIRFYYDLLKVLSNGAGGGPKLV